MIHLPDDDLNVIREVLASYSCVKWAKVFGSRAKGTHRKGSDVDIAVALEHKSENQLADIYRALDEETHLPYFFDLVDVRDIKNAELAEHINRVGELLYTKEVGVGS